jgi:hypothetical protein
LDAWERDKVAGLLRCIRPEVALHFICCIAALASGIKIERTWHLATGLGGLALAFHRRPARYRPMGMRTRRFDIMASLREHAADRATLVKSSIAKSI